MLGAARCEAWPPLLHNVAFCIAPACRFEEVLADSPVDAVIDLVGGEYETRSMKVSLRLGNSYSGAQERSRCGFCLIASPSAACIQPSRLGCVAVDAQRTSPPVVVHCWGCRC